VNLACQAVIAAITNLDFVAEDELDAILSGTPLDGIEQDIIERIRSIRASSLRRQQFLEIIRSLSQDELQLLRDVDTRWSAVLLMIDRALLLHAACFCTEFDPIDKFLLKYGFEDYRLSTQEWKALERFKDVLAIPHAFQQRLSAEKTPTLAYALPAFEGMVNAWEKQKVAHPELAHIIDQGLNKLDTYQEHVQKVPAYTLAM
ncbi:hypothetical protein C8F01DRAFT_958642, partial [Mycena amicta]